MLGPVGVLTPHPILLSLSPSLSRQPFTLVRYILEGNYINLRQPFKVKYIDGCVFALRDY